MPGNQQTFSNWQGGWDAGAGADRQPVIGPFPHFRNAKDAQLSAFGSSPDTNYPDGYLGTQGASSRRQDKLVDAVYRTNTRSYSRGVHKGERVNPGDYLWPTEFNPMSGIQNQTTGMKFATGTSGAVPVHLTNDGKAGPRGIPSGLDRDNLELVNMQRRSMLKTLLPQWR
jgi:hypothetical protein